MQVQSQLISMGSSHGRLRTFQKSANESFAAMSLKLVATSGEMFFLQKVCWSMLRSSAACLIVSI
jgi:hypothetical protein